MECLAVEKSDTSVICFCEQGSVQGRRSLAFPVFPGAANWLKKTLHTCTAGISAPVLHFFRIRVSLSNFLDNLIFCHYCNALDQVIEFPRDMSKLSYPTTETLFRSQSYRHHCENSDFSFVISARHKFPITAVQRQFQTRALVIWKKSEIHRSNKFAFVFPSRCFHFYTSRVIRKG